MNFLDVNWYSRFYVIPSNLDVPESYRNKHVFLVRKGKRPYVVMLMGNPGQPEFILHEKGRPGIDDFYRVRDWVDSILLGMDWIAT